MQRTFLTRASSTACLSLRQNHGLSFCHCSGLWPRLDQRQRVSALIACLYSKWDFVDHNDCCLLSRSQLWCADLQIEFWRNELAGAPDLLALPTAQARPQVASGEGVNIPFNVSPDLLQAIRQLAQANSCTLIMFFTAAYQV